MKSSSILVTYKKPKRYGKNPRPIIPGIAFHHLRFLPNGDQAMRIVWKENGKIVSTQSVIIKAKRRRQS